MLSERAHIVHTRTLLTFALISSNMAFTDAISEVSLLVVDAVVVAVDDVVVDAATDSRD